MHRDAQSAQLFLSHLVVKKRGLCSYTISAALCSSVAQKCTSFSRYLTTVTVKLPRDIKMSREAATFDLFRGADLSDHVTRSRSRDVTRLRSKDLSASALS